MINRRLNELNRELLSSENNYEKLLYENRIARLSGNLLKMTIGGNSASKIDEKKARVQELLVTLKSSLEEGYLIGGTSFYILLYKELKYWGNFNLIGDEIYAIYIFLHSLKELSLNLFKDTKYSAFAIFQNLLVLSYPYTYTLEYDCYINGQLFGFYESAKSFRFLFSNSLSMLCNLINLNWD